MQRVCVCGGGGGGVPEGSHVLAESAWRTRGGEIVALLNSQMELFKTLLISLKKID